jgi:hypothetical protein
MRCICCPSLSASPSPRERNALPTGTPICPACAAAVTACQVGIVKDGEGYSVTDGRARVRPVDGTLAEQPRLFA